MDASLLPVLCEMIQCTMALSRLHSLADNLDSSEFDSFYNDVSSLKVSISSFCDKYSKN